MQNISDFAQARTMPPKGKIAPEHLHVFAHNATLLSPDPNATCVYRPEYPGHNGIRFDFPMLLSECYRCNMPLDAMNNWKYADTLAVARVLDQIVFGGCMKLQCMLRISAAHDLRAHRALDDAIVLRSVTTHLSDTLGVSILRLLELFVVQLDASTSLAQLSVVI